MSNLLTVPTNPPTPPKRNRWKIAFFVLSFLFLVLLGTSAYTLLDQAVSLTYLKEGYEGIEGDLSVLKKILPEVNPSLRRRDWLVLLRKTHPDALIADDKEGLRIGFLGFTFDAQGRLKEVIP